MYEQPSPPKQPAPSNQPRSRPSIRMPNRPPPMASGGLRSVVPREEDRKLFRRGTSRTEDEGQVSTLAIPDGGRARSIRESVQETPVPATRAPRPAPAGGRPKPKLSPQKPAYPRARVLYNYPKSDTDEIGIETGEIIQVVMDNPSEGWWIGLKSDGTKGFFPAAYVQKLPC